MCNVISCLPKPFHDLSLIWSQDQASKSEEQEAKAKKILIRLAVTAAEFFLYSHYQLYLPTVVSLGVVISLPATSIYLGVYLINLACKKIFQNLPVTIACAASGWFLLHLYEIYPFGLLERFLPRGKPLSLTTSPHPAKEEWLEKPEYVSHIYQQSMIAHLSAKWTNLGKFSDFQESEDIDLGIFSYKSLIDKLNTKEVIEFCYCYNDLILQPEETYDQGTKITGGNQQQIAYGCFANTFEKAFLCDGAQWASREHYYQAQKFIQGSATYLKIQQAQGSFAAPRNLKIEVKKEIYKIDLRLKSTADWKKWRGRDSFLIAMHANLAYFGQHREDREFLLSTDNFPLIQRDKNPNIWGISYRDNVLNWIGKDGKAINRNRQGWILMYLRNHFRNL